MMKKIYLGCAMAVLAVVAVSAQKGGEDTVPLGSKDSAKWTDTTTEAAATPEQKQWLNQGKPMTISGELVDVSCYMQLGKTGPSHVDCGGKCLRSGQPAGILTAKKELYLLMAEQHHPRRDGQADIRETLAANMGKQVAVTGMVQKTKQGKSMFVSAVDLTGKN